MLIVDTATAVANSDPEPLIVTPLVIFKVALSPSDVCKVLISPAAIVSVLDIVNIYNKKSKNSIIDFNIHSYTDHNNNTNKIVFFKLCKPVPDLYKILKKQMKKKIIKKI